MYLFEFVKIYVFIYTYLNQPQSLHFLVDHFLLSFNLHLFTMTSSSRTGNYFFISLKYHPGHVTTTLPLTSLMLNAWDFKVFLILFILRHFWLQGNHFRKDLAGKIMAFLTVFRTAIALTEAPSPLPLLARVSPCSCVYISIYTYPQVWSFQSFSMLGFDR